MYHRSHGAQIATRKEEVGVKVFYGCYGRDEFIEEPEPMEETLLAGEAARVLVGPEDYFGVVDDAGTTLQFATRTAHELWAEIPQPERGGSVGVVMKRDDVLALLASLPERFTPQMLPNARFQSW